MCIVEEMPPYMAARAIMECMMSIVYNPTRADPKHNNAPVCVIVPGRPQLAYTHPCVSFACEAKEDA